MSKRYALAFFTLTLGLCTPGATWAAKAQVGDKAPWFKLKSVTGKVVTNKSMRGFPALLVVGTTRKAAPLCKDWVYKALEVYGRKIYVYQVIVADNPWFIPDHVVISKIKKMIDKKHLHRVLIEWYTVFADSYGVARSDLPTVFALNSEGIILWRHRGVLTDGALDTLRSKIRLRQE